MTGRFEVCYETGFECAEGVTVIVTFWFAVYFMCGVERRRSVVLGTEPRWPSDFFSFSALWRGLNNAGELHICLMTCWFVQVGDGTTTQRNTPVGVVGLSSGILMVSLGQVCFSSY